MPLLDWARAESRNLLPPVTLFSFSDSSGYCWFFCFRAVVIDAVRVKICSAMRSMLGLLMMTLVGWLDVDLPNAYLA